MSTVIEKAKSLGEALSNCEELKNLRDAEALMVKDLEAQSILQEFTQIQQELEEKHDQAAEITQDEQERMEAVEKKMQENPSISKFIEAQVAFENVLEEINQIISTAISGESECDTDACSSCGCGCH